MRKHTPHHTKKRNLVTRACCLTRASKRGAHCEKCVCGGSHQMGRTMTVAHRRVAACARAPKCVAAARRCSQKKAPAKAQSCLSTAAPAPIRVMSHCVFRSEKQLKRYQVASMSARADMLTQHRILKSIFTGTKIVCGPVVSVLFVLLPRS